jgi:glycine/D-amino acid oxidase-like deaminating enzyme
VPRGDPEAIVTPLQREEAPKVDHAVVGAGIVGAFAAYEAAAELPDRRIAVLERSLVASGATRYSAGLDFPYGQTPLRRSMASASGAVYADLAAADPTLPVRELPLLCVASTETLESHLGRFVGPKPRFATPDERRLLIDAYPGLRLADNQVILTGIRCRHGHPARVAAGLLERARALGTLGWEGAEVTGVRADRDGVLLSLADGRCLLAEQALLAPGPWALRGPASAIARRAGMRVKKVVSLHVDSRPQNVDPVLFLLDDDAFLLPLLDDGRRLFSFTAQEWDCPPESSRLRITREDRELALSVLRRFCPPLVPLSRSGRVFADAYGPNSDPVIATDPALPNVVLAGGGSGSGYRLAPAIARRALELLSALGEERAGRRALLTTAPKQEEP